MATRTDLRNILGQTFDFGTNDVITGTLSDDTISVHGGNDTVIASAGNDLIFDKNKLSGGPSGYDVIYGADGNDTVVSTLDGGNEYYGGAGADTFISGATNGSYIDLALEVARDRSINVNSRLSGFENATGSMLSDYVYGNAGNNTLHGNWGDDLVRGQNGNDLLYGDQGQDVLFGGNNDDYARGGEGHDMVYGENGIDLLMGDNGNDTLIGGLGRDSMHGGAGSDTFKFASLADSGVTGSTADMIADFQHLADRIDVRDIDARTGVSGNQAFTFIGNNAFSAAGQIRYVFDSGSQDTVVLFNTDNDAAAEMILKIDPRVILSASDFYL